MSTLKVIQIQHPSAASAALTLDASGNLSTSGTLTFPAGSASSPSIQATGDPNTGLFFPAADTIAFAEGGTEVLRIDSSGRVGIGTSAPSNTLHVSGTAGTPVVFERTNTTGTFLALKDSTSQTFIGNTNGVFSIQTPGSSYSDKFVVTSGGLVGIGTSSPNKPLQIYSGSVDSEIRLQTNSGTEQNAYITLRNSGGKLDIYSVNSDIALNPGNSVAATFKADGKVGIGTASPSVKLEISGAANQNEIRSVDGTINSQWYQDNNGYAIFGTFSNHPQVFRTNGSERLRIPAAGGFCIGSSTSPNSLTATSGIRLGGSTIASYDFINVTTTPVTIANGVGIGGFGFVQAYNTSSGAQYTGIIMWRAGVVAVISESNALGFGLTYSVSGSTLRLQTASGTVTGSIISLAS
jgi:hypothetical protein